MHPEALQLGARGSRQPPRSDPRLGGRYINGTPRIMFPNADYLVLDIEDGSRLTSSPTRRRGIRGRSFRSGGLLRSLRAHPFGGPSSGRLASRYARVAG
jgi:hypothetical protein